MPPGQAAKIPDIHSSRTAGVYELTCATEHEWCLDSALIRRPPLVRRLLDAAARPLAVIVGPPGYGKSTLLAEWEQSDPRPFVWLSASSARTELTELIEAARAHHQSFVAVLDDADRLDPQEVRELVPAALNDLPGSSTIALASRIEPPLPLGRLRAHRMLAEVRIGDLTMTISEGDTLLRREGVELSPEEVRALVRHAEGWPAALYLAALWLREAPGELASFSGQQHLMFEYLRDEVLVHLPERFKHFAVRTSMLDELSGPLCDAVLEQHGSGSLLSELAQLTPLLAPVDPNHSRYRWHTLVREALASELDRIEPEIVPKLRRRASAWYCERGETRRAIDHAARAGDAELAGDLLCQNLLAYLSRGGREMVVGWLQALGEDKVSGYAPLALSASFSCLAAGRVDEAQRWSVTANAALERRRAGRGDTSISAGLDLLRATTGRTSLAAMGELAQRAIQGEPVNSQWRPLGLLLVAVSAHLRGDPVAADNVLEETISVAGHAAPSVAALALAQRAMIAIQKPDWELAEELSERAAMVLTEWDLTNDPPSALVFAAAAASRAHQGRVDEAKRDLRRGIDLLAALGDFIPWYGAETRILLAHASLWLADVVGARTLLAEASRLARKAQDGVVFGQWFDEAWAYMDTLAETKLAGPSSLTIAELRILRFLPSHLSFREIADQLNVSANTVKTQAHAVYRKLGAASRSEAVTRAVEAGLLG